MVLLEQVFGASPELVFEVLLEQAFGASPELVFEVLPEQAFGASLELVFGAQPLLPRTKKSLIKYQECIKITSGIYSSSTK
jgi:hypothetical protein